MMRISFKETFPRDWFWETLYAVRLPGKPGWHVAFIATSLETAIDSIKVRHQGALECLLLDLRTYAVRLPARDPIHAIRLESTGTGMTDRLPNNLDWELHTLAPAEEHAPAAIMKKHPDALEYRIIRQDRTRKDHFHEEFVVHDTHQLSSWGWYYEPSIENWLAPGEPCPRPSQSPLPAVLAIEHAPPEDGWWIVHLTFSPQTPLAQAAWRSAGETHESIQAPIMCTNTYESPLEDLTQFVAWVKSGTFARIVIDEEGTYVHMTAWSIDDDTIQLYMESEGHRTNYCINVLLERAQFVTVFEKTLEEFHAMGGWDAEDDDDC